MGNFSFFLCNLSSFTKDSWIRMRCKLSSNRQSNESGRQPQGEIEALQIRWGTINGDGVNGLISLEDPDNRGGGHNGICAFNESPNEIITMNTHLIIRVI